MPVVVIVVSMLAVLVMTTPSVASPSCMTKTEARRHFGSAHIFWHGPDHCWDATPSRLSLQVDKFRRTLQTRKTQQELSARKDEPSVERPKWYDSMSKMLPDDDAAQTPWEERWVNIESAHLPLAARWVDIVQVKASVGEEPEPMVSLRTMILVFVVIALVIMLASIEILFRNEIWGIGRRQSRPEI